MEGDPDRTSDALIAGLNDAQARAVTTDAAPLAILAGAGSGKTRVLTRRIARRVADGEIDASHVLAVTFTRKAAAELRDRLSSRWACRPPCRPAPSTPSPSPNSASVGRSEGSRLPSVLDRKVGFVARLVRGGGSATGGGASSTLPLDLVCEIEWAKARHGRRRIAIAEAAAAAGASSTSDRRRTRSHECSPATRRTSWPDGWSTSTTCCGSPPATSASTSRYAAAGAGATATSSSTSSRTSTRLQFELLRAWLGDRVDLCVVGDPNQAIYSWNGADASYLADFDRHFPGADHRGALRELPVVAADPRRGEHRAGDRTPIQHVPAPAEPR